MDFFLLSLWAIPTILIWLSLIYYVIRTEDYRLIDSPMILLFTVSIIPFLNLILLIVLILDSLLYGVIKQDFCNHEFYKRVWSDKRIATCKKCGLELSVPRKEKEKEITYGFSIGESQGILATAIKNHEARIQASINQARFGPKR